MAGIGDVRDIMRGAVASLFGFGGRLAARAILMVAAGRLFGLTEIGLLAQFAAISEMTAAIGVMGLKRSLLDMLSHRAERGLSIHQRVVEALGVALACGLALSALLGVVWWFVPTRNAVVLPLLLLNVPATILTEVALAAIKFKRVIKWDVWAHGINEPWGFLILALGLYGFGVSEGGLIMAYVGSVLIAAATAIAGLLKIYGLRPLLGAKPSFRSCLGIPARSFPVGLTDLGSMMLRRIDILVLGLYVPVEGVGLYYMVQQLATIPQKVNALFEPMMSPVIARLHNRLDAARIRANLVGICRWVFILQLALTIPMMIFGDVLLSAIGPQFAVGGIVLAIVLLAELIDGSFLLAETPLVFASPITPPLLLLVALGIEIVLIAGLSRLWGVEGAAVGFLLAISALAAGRLIMVSRRLNIQIVNSSYLLPSAFGLLIGTLLLFVRRWLAPDHNLLVLLWTAFILAGFVHLIRTFALTASDRILLRAFVQKRQRVAVS